MTLITNLLDYDIEEGNLAREANTNNPDDELDLDYVEETEFEETEFSQSRTRSERSRNNLSIPIGAQPRAALSAHQNSSNALMTI